MHCHADFEHGLRYERWCELTAKLPVINGEVQRDEANGISKVAVVDCYSGKGLVSEAFRKGVGPTTPDSALTCSVNHDLYNIWVLGSSDAALALASTNSSSSAVVGYW